MKFPVLAVGLAVLAAVGCARPAAEVPKAELPGEPALGLEDYRVQVGDELEVRFYKTPTMNVSVVVRPDGKISLELLDDLPVVGMRPVELDALLTDRYAKELKEPRITVIVRKFGGQRVYVGGEVGRPAVLTLAGGMTALQAIHEAGGFKETAATDSVVVIRRSGDGRRQGQVVDLDPVLSGERADDDVALAPYDVVFVPRTRIANLDIFMDQYVRKILPVNPSLGANF